MSPIHPRPDILWLENCESTNNEVRRLSEGLDNLSIVSAISQSSGRGQGTHIWYSRPGMNLTFSLWVNYPDIALRASELVLVTCFLSLGIRDYLMGKGIKSVIKWPNDIYVGGRKICGILIENTLDGPMLKNTIAGIGLNVNETDWPEGTGVPVSMKELTGKDYSIQEEIVLLSERIRRRYPMLSGTSGRIRLQDEFEKVLITKV